MIDWSDLELAAPSITEAGARLLERNEVAFLATVSAAGRPRVHPFVPRVVEGNLLAFIMNTSPKIRDLRERHLFSIHALPGAEDEEFYVSGKAVELTAEHSLRPIAANAMGFATGVGSSHVLFHFLFDRALHTQWLDFGTPVHRPVHTVWRLDAESDAEGG